MLQGVSKKIRAIKFAYLSPKEIREMSEKKIVTADTYDEDGYPIPDGLMDTHLGVVDPGLQCATCKGKVDTCLGHFGHIELAMPVIHVGYVKEIKKLLQATCQKCGRLMLNPEEITKFKTSLNEIDEFGGTMQDIVELTKGTSREATKQVCPWCGTCEKCTAYIENILSKDQPCPICGDTSPKKHTEQKKITLDKPTTFREEGHKLTPKEIRERLERIPDEDLELLGINPKIVRPEWMVLTVLPVPPVTMRPSITLETGDRSEDDLTHKLVDVLRINQRLRENRDAGSPQLIVEDLWDLLQYHITTYFDNQTSGIPPARHRSGRPLKTLIQRLKGKEGRFRSNLSGKRVNFSARTVISPDPFISINEVGVPVEIARELTLSIHVTPYNLDYAREIVRRGPTPKEGDRYLPGANYAVRPDGRRVRVTEKNAMTVAENVDVGWTVERHLTDGDIVLFNRQPSLHRMSMMAHYVKVLPHKTFRLNLCVCPPYNADFDGDEMNLHVLQSEESRAEAKMLMMVEQHTHSPRFGGPIIGAVHDHITGAFLITHKNTKFDLEDTLYILSRVDIDKLPRPDIVEGKKKFWSGKNLVSLALPTDLSLKFKASIHPGPGEEIEAIKLDAIVDIRKGKILKGTIDGKAISAFKGKILDKISRDYGPEHVKNFLDTITKICLEGIMVRGFTTGIDDEDIPDEAKRQIHEEMVNVIKEVNALVESYHQGTLEPMPGRSLKETLEVAVMKVLGRARDEAGRIAGRYLGLDNSAVVMAKTGARGSMLNLSQMAGCIGQQAVRGERLYRGYTDRTLPHFKRNDLGAEAHGFVQSCYKSGLKPTEFFFHAMGGREGLVDTAVRTSRSGYMQRRLINALVDIKVKEDNTVRNTANTIIQFSYGEDSIDPSKSVGGSSIDLDDILLDILGDEHPLFKKGVVEDKFANLPGFGEQETDMAYGAIEEEMGEEEAEEETFESEDHEYGGE